MLYMLWTYVAVRVVEVWDAGCRYSILLPFTVGVCLPYATHNMNATARGSPSDHTL